MEAGRERPACQGLTWHDWFQIDKRKAVTCKRKDLRAANGVWAEAVLRQGVVTRPHHHQRVIKRKLQLSTRS